MLRTGNFVSRESVSAKIASTAELSSLSPGCALSRSLFVATTSTGSCSEQNRNINQSIDQSVNQSINVVIRSEGAYTAVK